MLKSLIIYFQKSLLIPYLLLNVPKDDDVTDLINNPMNGLSDGARMSRIRSCHSESQIIVQNWSFIQSDFQE